MTRIMRYRLSRPDAPLILPRGTYGFVHLVLDNIPGGVTSRNDDTALEAGLTLWDLLQKLELKITAMNSIVGIYELD